MFRQHAPGDATSEYEQAPIFDPPDTDNYPRSWVASWGLLEVSSERIKFIPEKGEGLGLDFPRADYKVIGGARGYPRVLITQVSSGNQYTILYRSGAGVTKKYNDGPGETVAMLDAAPLLEALGGSFQPLAARLLPKPALLIASKPAGAEIFLDAKSMGKTDTQGSLKLENLVPVPIRCGPLRRDTRTGASLWFWIRANARS